MRTIIAGSRTCKDYTKLKEAIASAPFTPVVVLSGTAKGVDKMGERWANENNIPIERYYPQWNLFGHSAGYKRNCLMAVNADALIALWDGESRGTMHMIDIATKQGLQVHVVIIEKDTVMKVLTAYENPTKSKEIG